MRRTLAHVSEIARRSDNAAAKVKLPQPVDQHARRQRIIGGNEPICERLATISFGCIRWQHISFRGIGKRTYTFRNDVFTLALRIAPFKHMLSASRLLEAANV